MKKMIFRVTVGAIAVSSTLFSCTSKERKVEEERGNAQEARQDLREAERELNAEYPAFRIDAEEKIVRNEKRIVELRAIVDKPGTKAFDGMRKKRIEELSEKNALLRSRLNAYEKERSDWEVFKREFNHDMNQLGEAFSDLGNKNTK